MDKINLYFTAAMEWWYGCTWAEAMKIANDDHRWDQR